MTVETAEPVAETKVEPTTEQLSLKRIFKQREEITLLSLELAAAAAKHKVAKASYESAVAQMLRIVDDERNPELPFSDPPSAGEQSPDAWKSVSLREVRGLGEGELAALAEAGIETIGKMSEYTSQHRLTDIKGIGDAKAEKIENAMAEYWNEHPIPEPEDEDDDEDGDEGDE